MKPYHTALCWFRRDLRSYDHAALYHALKQSEQVYCVFVFDTEILGQLRSKADRRVEFIWHSLRELRDALQQMGGGLIVRHGAPGNEIPALAQQLQAQAVFFNHDYEPDAIRRDQHVTRALHDLNIAAHSFKDQVIFERDEVLSQAGQPFSIFTPYKKAWLKKLDAFHLQAYPVARYAAALAVPPVDTFPRLEEIGFARSNLSTLGTGTGMSGARHLWQGFQDKLAAYHVQRDYPAIAGTSRLSVHLRFGTLSIRELAAHAYYTGGAGAETWLGELVWRDFFQMILYYHPRVVNEAFRGEFNGIAWDNREDYFAAWKQGRTGYPLIDAAMRQLAQSGTLHNRLRMVVASFLVKDLQVDWRWGERYFAEQLLDYDPAANNGNWQWAASTGCDAQPYFRIFNPVTQSRKFDPDGSYIRRFVPELAACDAATLHAPWLAKAHKLAQAGLRLGHDYPAPIVDHGRARGRTLALFQSAREKGKP